MGAFKQYIYSILLVSMAAGMIHIFTPDSGNNGIKKYVKYLLSLAVVLALLLPLKNLLYGLPKLLRENTQNLEKNTVPIETGQAQKWVIQQSTQDICEGISNIINQRYSIAEDDLKITLSVNKENFLDVILEKITIQLLNKEDFSRAGEIKIYVEKLLACKTEIRMDT